MNARGGSEILISNLQKYVGIQELNKINFIISVCDNNKISSQLSNVVWQHLNTNENNVIGLKNKKFVDQISKFVFVSNWQNQKFQKEFDLPKEKCITIRNAIEPIEFIPKVNNNKLKLIYTSTPWRGLDILIESIKKLNRKDIELDVYSSTVIYGTKFLPGHFDWLFEKCRRTPCVNYKGYVTNKAIRQSVQHAHIFTYPSIFEETSCLSAIEAAAAGCRLVLTNFGALPETCESWAKYCDYSTDKEKLINDYAEILNNEIDTYWENYPSYKIQSDYFNEKYSWQNRKHKWIQLINQLKK